MTRRFFDALLALLVPLAVLTSAGAWAAPDGKTLVFCSEGSPAGFDPAQYTSGTDFDASAWPLFDRLVEFRAGTTTIEPGLAQSWDVSADGRVYTFHLRRGVKFATTPYFKPTRDFDADDVVFTFGRMLDARQPFQHAYPVMFPYFHSTALDQLLVAVDKQDANTVRFTLKAADAAFIQDLAMPFASIQSAQYAGQLLAAGQAQEIDDYPVGTGPFILRGYQKDAVIRYMANPDYWNKDKVKLSHLIFAITPDAQVRAQKLQAGDCQIMSDPLPASLPALRADPKLAVPSQTGFNLGYLAYNVKHAPLDRLAVRQALDMAIDKPALIAAVFQGAAVVAHGPMPPTQWGYDTSLKDAPHDLARARRLLRQAGFPHGFSLTLWAMPVQRPYNPNARLMAEMIQADWAKIGVRAKIVTYEWGEYVRRAHAGEHDALLIGLTGDNGDPDNWLGTLLSCHAGGGNFTNWCDPRFDALLAKARATTDRARRIGYYTRAQEIFKHALPFTPIANSIVYQPMSAQVHGYHINPFGPHQFGTTGLK